MNRIFYAIIAISFVVAGITGKMAEVTTAAIDASKAAVTLAIGLIGVMALFLGLMQVMQEAGALKAIARVIRPVMVRLFPDVPPTTPPWGP